MPVQTTPATDPASLLAAASCFQCFAGSPTQINLCKLALLAQILKKMDPMTDTSPQTLLAQANCFACYGSSPALLQLMELALLVQLVALASKLSESEQ